jgi:hypothetical protein
MCHAVAARPFSFAFHACGRLLTWDSRPPPATRPHSHDRQHPWRPDRGLHQGPAVRTEHLLPVCGGCDGVVAFAAPPFPSPVPRYIEEKRKSTGVKVTITHVAIKAVAEVRGGVRGLQACIAYGHRGARDRAGGGEAEGGGRGGNV